MPTKSKQFIYSCALIFTFAFGGKFGYAQSFDNLGDKQIFSAGGSLALNNSFYLGNNNGNFPFGKTSPYQWSIVGTPWVSLYDIMIPFTFTLGKGNSSFEHPFFQFGLSPTYKWATVHLGYRNMVFNPYTLNGHTFAGVGVELNPKKWRIAAMWGRLSPAIAYDTTSAVFALPAYKRKGFGGKLGYGSESNYVDVMFFKAKDKVNSIIAPPWEQQITPAENLSMGLATKQRITKNIEWYGDLGLSLYTRDLNASYEYYGEDEAINKFNFLFTPNLSSRANMAFKTGVNLNVKSFRLGAEFEQVDPEYQTMGSYFFANDFRKYSLTPSFTLVKNKIRINGSYVSQRNNLLETRLQTTFRNNLAASVDISPKPTFGVNLIYNNFNIFQKEGTVVLIDSVALNMATHSFGIIPRYTIIGKEMVQSFTMVFNYQTLVDNNLASQKFTQSNTVNFNLNGSFNWIKTKRGLNLGINYLDIDNAFAKTVKYGVTAGYNMRALKEKLNLRFQGNFSLNNTNKTYNGHTETLSIIASYAINKMHQFNFNTSFLNNSYKTIPSYFEMRATLSYVFTISTPSKK